jgi:type II secretory pathway predicted ATPase ExeA
MNYLDFYGLQREPFSNTPDQRFFWNGRYHQVALTKLSFALHQRRGLMLVTGEIGAGKTTLARQFFETLDDGLFHKALLVVIHSEITADWLLHRFAHLLGVAQPKHNKLELLGQIYERLRIIDEEGRIVALLIDEAQMLGTRELMEEFRGLLNIEARERKLINFVFFGLPEVEENLRLDEPLRQRVALRIHLQRYDAQDTQDYIAHRINIAGGKPTLIPPETAQCIHHHSLGSPRLINALGDNLLLEGFLARTRALTPEMADQAAADLNLKPPEADPLAEVLGRRAGRTPSRDGETWQDVDLDKLLDFLEDEPR